MITKDTRTLKVSHTQILRNDGCEETFTSLVEMELSDEQDFLEIYPAVLDDLALRNAGTPISDSRTTVEGEPNGHT